MHLDDAVPVFARLQDLQAGVDAARRQVDRVGRAGIWLDADRFAVRRREQDQFAKRLRPAERIGVRGADEASGLVALGLLGGVIAQLGLVEWRAHAGRAGEKRRVDAG